MASLVPAAPSIFHIVHIDRLASILASGCLLCDAEMINKTGTGTVIGMSKIKQRRLTELTLASHPGLFVGSCVPFYFCPRSVMLFLIHKANEPELAYKGGEDPIIHLEGDLNEAIKWAEDSKRRWAFTLSNAGSYDFEDRADLAALHEVNWGAINTNWWAGRNIDPSITRGKQAEFLIEGQFPWHLVRRVGVKSQGIGERVTSLIADQTHRPEVRIMKGWYYGA